MAGSAAFASIGVHEALSDSYHLLYFQQKRDLLRKTHIEISLGLISQPPENLSFGLPMQGLYGQVQVRIHLLLKWALPQFVL